MSGAAQWVDERLIGPGARPAERVVGYATGVLGGVLAGAGAVGAGWSSPAVAVVAVVAFDLFGGAAVNATSVAKRHFHRPGRTARHHLGFVAVHVQPFLLALVVPGFGWGTAAVVYALALTAALAVTRTPAGPQRRPLAFAVTVLAIAAATLVSTVPDELAWFTPVLLIKLLLAHLLPEDTAP
ncbi:hypothetical protein [Streptomyces aureocirculatus]|uniref:hypothetical protein n=1 Tax=Streptomyces aureocirculatus TaxID=67275 RepID=UPI0004C69E31|nr:hypothetical protein [Streptomyces aureocirculatus]